ncbi:MAG: isoleucine--tRNA ligase [Erysipelotrichaceae bacterium]|nr:isoleucine--tRNA ligase [Erysipelotrichaceae bacterium]
MEIKDTLLMPKTKFEMRGNLPNKEPNILKRWEEIDLYNLMLMKNKDNKHFILHDGPPYANGSIHMGHALNKVLKDFIVRYKTMQGFYTPYIPGWDTHGLPIESALQKAGVNRKSMAPGDFKDLCYEYALKQVSNQMEQFKRLGSVGDYDHPYKTLDFDFEARQIEVFAKMVEKGLIFKGLKPVYWSPSSESALAEAEIEYQDKTDTSIFVKFEVNKGNEFVSNGDYFVIWTTTPWTIPANLAICLNEQMEYGLYRTNHGNLVIALDLLENVKTKANLEVYELIRTFKGKDVEGLSTKHPLYDRDSVIILGDHVSNEDGTGSVHTAPGHGAEDFIVGKKYGLDILCPVDTKGLMTEEAGPRLVGLPYYEANKVVLEMLDECGALLAKEEFMHSYPHDWRTKKPVIFRATSQWFATLDPIREELLEAIDTVKWASESNKIRLYNMIKDRGDWCISRQRLWGVPLPIFYAEDGTPIMTKETLKHVSDLFRQYGSNVWSKREAKDLLPEGFTHPGSPNGIFTKENDIMDVWFDSGSSHTGVLVERGLPYPSDLYLEGSDQYRGWFNSSLIIGVAVHGLSPYKAIVSHGFVVDGKGQKMSKSLGNVVDPLKVISTYGADILRLWASSIDYTCDAKVDDNIIKQVSETYRKIRNTFRFLLGNLTKGNSKYDPLLDKEENLEEIDNMILNQLNKVTNSVIESYDNYNFAGAVSSIMNFMTTDLSSFYLDIIKDSLYCDSKNSLRRRQIQTVLYKLTDRLVRMLAPILSFTMEEIANEFYDIETIKSVHLLDFPKKERVNDELSNKYSCLLKVRQDVLKALEEARQSSLIGSAQEALVYLDIKDENVKAVYETLSEYNKYMIFIVSEVITGNNDGKEYEVSKVKVLKHHGEKCERCWNRFDSSKIVDNVCERCHKVIKEVESYED